MVGGSKGDDRRASLRGVLAAPVDVAPLVFFRMAFGLLLAWAEMATMIAIVISTAFPKCTQHDDCYLGQACVQLQA